MARIPKHPYQVEVVVSCPKTADDISKRVVDIMTGSLSAEPGAIPRAEQHLRKNVASMVAAAVAEERSRCLAAIDGAIARMQGGRPMVGVHVALLMSARECIAGGEPDNQGNEKGADGAEDGVHGQRA